MDAVIGTSMFSTGGALPHYRLYMSAKSADLTAEGTLCCRACPGFSITANLNGASAGLKISTLWTAVMKDLNDSWILKTWLPIGAIIQ